MNAKKPKQTKNTKCIQYTPGYRGFMRRGRGLGCELFPQSETNGSTTSLVKHHSCSNVNLYGAAWQKMAKCKCQLHNK